MTRTPDTWRIRCDRGTAQTRNLHMKRRKVKPIGKRAAVRPAPSAEPERLKDFVEDPLPEKRDMTAEQKAAFNRPEDPDPRVGASESD